MCTFPPSKGIVGLGLFWGFQFWGVLLFRPSLYIHMYTYMFTYIIIHIVMPVRSHARAAPASPLFLVEVILDQARPSKVRSLVAGLGGHQA